MEDELRKWGVPFIATAIVAALWWAAGAWVKMLSRKEAIATVNDAFRAHNDLTKEWHRANQEKMEDLKEGQRAIVREAEKIARRVGRVERALNGSLTAWDGETERRQS